MDTTKMLSDLWTVSPVVAVLGIIAYVLWKKLEKKDADQKEMLTAHDNDRKETQEKIFQIVNQNSQSHLQLSSSVDNLGKTMTDQFKSLESKVDRAQRAPRQRSMTPSQTT